MMTAPAALAALRAGNERFVSELRSGGGGSTTERAGRKATGARAAAAYPAATERKPYAVGPARGAVEQLNHGSGVHLHRARDIAEDYQPPRSYGRYRTDQPERVPARPPGLSQG